MAKLMPQNSEVNCDLIALGDFDWLSTQGPWKTSNDLKWPKMTQMTSNNPEN